VNILRLFKIAVVLAVVFISGFLSGIGYFDVMFHSKFIREWESKSIDEKVNTLLYGERKAS